MKELKRVLIMAGGTGGHVFPGLALAQYLREKGVEVHWLGTSQGLEARVVPDAKFPLHLVNIRGLRGKGIKPLLAAPLHISKAVWQSKCIIQKVNPDVVVGLGGFVSGPGGLASWITKKPLIIHEQNAKAGLTNKLLSYVAKRVLAGFPTSFKSGNHVEVIGNPVRVEIESLPAPEKRLNPSRSPFRLLILGGSLGAQALNNVVPRAVAKIEEKNRPIIFHQTGPTHFEETKKLYATIGIEANVVPFVNNMAEAYSWADMVICRAGALTVAELCAAGLGAILVPFPFAVDDHQTANASFMVHGLAAQCIPQSELTESRLADIVREYTMSPEKCLAMAQAAYQLRQVNVVEKIYDICKEVYH